MSMFAHLAAQPYMIYQAIKLHSTLLSCSATHIHIRLVILTDTCTHYRRVNCAPWGQGDQSHNKSAVRHCCGSGKTQLNFYLNQQWRKNTLQCFFLFIFIIQKKMHCCIFLPYPSQLAEKIPCSKCYLNHSYPPKTNYNTCSRVLVQVIFSFRQVEI